MCRMLHTDFEDERQRHSGEEAVLVRRLGTCGDKDATPGGVGGGLARVIGGGLGCRGGREEIGGTSMMAKGVMWGQETRARILRRS